MQRGIRLLLLFIPPLIVVIMVGVSPLSAWFDRVVYDLLSQQYRSVSQVDTDVVIVDIDQESIDKLSGWPFNREVHASAIEVLTESEVSSITYNVAFTAPDTDPKSGDYKLLAAIQASGRVVLPLIAEEGKELGPLDRMELEGAMLGHADMPLDSDGRLRRSYLYAGMEFPRWPSLALATLHTYAPVKADLFSGLRTPYLHVGFSKHWSRDYEVLVPLGLNEFVESIERISLLELLSGEISSDQLRNKAVFVGLKDERIERKLQVAGNGRFSATELHAFNFSALSRNYTLSPSLPVWAIILGVLLTLCWGCFFLKLALSLRIMAVVACVVIACIPCFFLAIGYWIGVLPMLVGVVMMSVAVYIRRLFFQRTLKSVNA